MKRILIQFLRNHPVRSLLFLTVACLLFVSAAEGGMLGSRIQLETFYPSFDSQTSSRPIKTVTATGIEFPDISQYDVNSPPGTHIVNVNIDFDDSSITISFTGAGSFLTAPVNTYVFTDIDDTMPDFTGFAIDNSVTTLGIQPAAVTFTKDQLLINVSGLSFDDTTLAKFDVTFGPQTVRLANISTRLEVETGDNVLIGGFIITGTEPKSILARAIGPSLPLTGALADPFLELHDSTGAIIASNDNWVNSPNKQAIIDSTIPPTNDKESAIIRTLAPGAYTAIVRGAGDGSGISLVEVYDLESSAAPKLANISTRGLVQTDDDVLIGGVIVAGEINARVLVRAIGPSLSLDGALEDTTLDLYDANGAVLASNDNWRSDQEDDLIATTIPPSNDLEAAIIAVLSPGPYTAIVRGKDGTTGLALVEAYQLNN